MNGGMTTASSSVSLEAMLANVHAWVEVETPSRNAQAIGRLARMIEVEAREAGLDAAMTDLGDQVGPLLAVRHRRAGDERAGILVLAHLDTVHPVGTLLRNPIRIEGDRLYGPGSYDMKGGACVALEALKQASRGTESLPIDMMFVPDEEIGSAASRDHIERAAASARYVLVCEPARAEGRCVTARKGIGALRLEAHGCAAHAGLQHERGRDAVRKLAHQVLALEAMTDYSRGITVNIGTIRGRPRTWFRTRHASRPSFACRLPRRPTRCCRSCGICALARRTCLFMRSRGSSVRHSREARPPAICWRRPRDMRQRRASTCSKRP